MTPISFEEFNILTFGENKSKSLATPAIILILLIGYGAIVQCRCIAWRFETHMKNSPTFGD
jgi:hypothetical protein